MSNKVLSDKLKSIPSSLFFPLNTASDLETFIIGMYVGDKVNHNNVEQYDAYSTFEKFVQKEFSINNRPWGKILEAVYENSLLMAKQGISEHEKMGSLTTNKGSYFDALDIALKNEDSFNKVLQIVRNDLSLFGIYNCNSLKNFYSGYLFSVTKVNVTEEGVRELTSKPEDTSFVNFYLPDFTDFLAEKTETSHIKRRYIDIITYLSFGQVDDAFGILLDNYFAFLEIKK
jgi:hypothetical protein